MMTAHSNVFWSGDTIRSVFGDIFCFVLFFFQHQHQFQHSLAILCIHPKINNSSVILNKHITLLLEWSFFINRIFIRDLESMSNIDYKLNLIFISFQAKKWLCVRRSLSGTILIYKRIYDTRIMNTVEVYWSVNQNRKMIARESETKNVSKEMKTEPKTQMAYVHIVDE